MYVVAAAEAVELAAALRYVGVWVAFAEAV
jgi:hypothetical protein